MEVFLFLQWLPEAVDVEARDEAMCSRRDASFMFSLYFFSIFDVHS